MTVSVLSSFTDGFASLSLEILGDIRGSFFITAREQDLSIFYSKTNSVTEAPARFTLSQILSAGNIIPELLESDIQKIKVEVTKFIEQCIKEKFLPSQYEKYLSTHNIGEEKTTEAAKAKSPIEIAKIIVANKDQLLAEATSDLKKERRDSPNLDAYFVQRISKQARSFGSTFHLLIENEAAKTMLIKHGMQGAIDALLEADRRRARAGSTDNRGSHMSRPSSPRVSSVTRVRFDSTDSQGFFRTVSPAKNQSRPSSPRQGSSKTITGQR